MKFSPLQSRESKFSRGVNWGDLPTPRRKEGREKSNRGIFKNPDLAKLFSLPLLRNIPISLKCGMIAFNTFIRETIHQNFDIFFENQDFRPESSKILSLCKFMNNFPSFTQSTPHKRRDGSRIFIGRVYETKLDKDWAVLRPAAPRWFRYQEKAVLALFDLIAPHVQTHFSTWWRVATSSASRSCKTPVAPSHSPNWFYNPWVNTPTWPALLPPADVLG